MASIEEIINESLEYIDGHNQRNDRFLVWTKEKATFTKTTLEKIVSIIEEKNAYFKSNLYVNESYAQLESNGKILQSLYMRTIILQSGKLPMLTFEDKGNSFRTIVEEGFQLHFNPMLNGKIHVFVYGHSTTGDKTENKSLGLIEHPKDINDEVIQNFVLEAIKYSKTTSFLFVKPKL